MGPAPYKVQHTKSSCGLGLQAWQISGSSMFLSTPSSAPSQKARSMPTTPCNCSAQASVALAPCGPGRSQWARLWMLATSVRIGCVWPLGTLCGLPIVPTARGDLSTRKAGTSTTPMRLQSEPPMALHTYNDTVLPKPHMQLSMGKFWVVHACCPW